jgi:uncharacterized membrane protein
MATPAAPTARTLHMTALLSSASPPRVRRLLLQAALVSLIPFAVVVAAVGPSNMAGALGRLKPLRLHAPSLGLILQQPLAVQLHLAAVLTALAIGIVLLIGVKGRTMHRALGWTWVGAMMTAAVSSLFIRMLNHGALSYIHLLSGWTIVTLPVGVAFARRHMVRHHARMMTGLFTGGLILAGLFAFFPGRLMWRMFFG